MTRVPSEQTMEAMRETIVETGRAVEDKLGRLAVKLTIVDSEDDAAEWDLRLLLSIAQAE